MHSIESDPLPDLDMGLHVVRWYVDGFRELRHSGLLSTKCHFELIDGLIVHRGAGVTSRHDSVVAAIERLLSQSNPAMTILVAHELAFDEFDSLVCPDIVVYDGADLPVLVIEVSDDAPRIDAQEKARLYARAGIPEYWHIDLAWNFIQTHEGPHCHGYGMRASGPAWRPLPSRFAPDGLVLDTIVAAAGDAA